jgi:large subunit ribosomal protein L18
MASKKPKSILYRRKREKRTNYTKRLHLLLSRKSRLVVRVSNQHIIAQISDFTAKGDKVLVAYDSHTLKKIGWDYSKKNLPAAYLSGYALAKKAVAANIKEAILDTGLTSPLPKTKLYAFLKGALDGGLEIPHGSDKIYPTQDRIQGKHIQNYAEQLKEKSKELYEKRFAKYLKNNTLPEKIIEQFTKTKEQIK